MKRKLFLWMLSLCGWLAAGVGMAQDFVNLTPKPYQLTAGTGTLALHEGFAVSTNRLPDSIAAQATFFARYILPDLKPEVKADDATATVQLAQVDGLEPEAYRLTIAADGVRLEASTATGFFYGFQTIGKVLTTANELPVCTVNDKPRFGYRGFMLDVARHFFPVHEIKKMLDLMARYKMNRFHWHLTDDQGWRLQIDKYPKLTTVGATAANCYVSSIDDGIYWTNQTYGPYFYSKQEVRDIVAYAAERHIEVIPEIEMPGHFCAAATAYPELSCTPYGTHSVQVTGGIYTDVMNVASPKARQFARDVIDEVMELFPGKYINIGGDECPTTAWQNNAECQALYEELGLAHYRQLQNHFVKDLADYIVAAGRKPIVWNEAISETGADVNLMKEAGVTVLCWSPAASSAKLAAQNGLNNVVTTYGPYYINRKQSTLPGEPSGAGSGTDNLQSVYAHEVLGTDVAASLQPFYTGVQGTFWTEHVADTAYLEYLALPRLFAVAEAGWTQRAAKNYADFQKRVTADAAWLEANGYNFCKHELLLGDEGGETGKVMPKAGTWYRIVTRATDVRQGTCIELLTASSPLVTQYAANGAQANRLWNNAQAAEGAENYDSQFWAFEEDPANPGKYAMVCKAAPDGSVNPSPTAQSNAGRWNYDPSTKNYNFVLGEAGYGQDGSNYYYTMRSDKLAGWYMNSSMAGQGYAVNLWTNAADGNGGLWTFVDPEAAGDGNVYDAFEPLEVGKVYRFSNSVAGFEGITLMDANTDSYLRHSADPYADNAWEVTAATVNADNSESVKLKNVQTGRFMTAPAAALTSRVGYPVSLNATGAELTLIYNKVRDEFTITSGAKNFYPVPATSQSLAGVIASGSENNESGMASRSQGAAWNIDEVRVVTFECTDTEGRTLGTFRRSVPVAEEAPAAPELPGHSLKSAAFDGNVCTAVYERTAYSVTTRCTDAAGALLAEDTRSVAVGETFTPDYGTFAYYTFASASETGPFVPACDTVLTAVYSTDALSGVKALGRVVSELQEGHSYVIYDTSPADAARIGYRNVIPDTKRVGQVGQIDDQTPYFTWTLTKSGTRWTVKNEYTGLYIPELGQSQQIIVGTTPGKFTFTLNADGKTWKIQGSNGQYWDGVVGGLTGWHTYGHAYQLFEYYAQPYYNVTLVCEDENGQPLADAVTEPVRAGGYYPLVVPSLADRTVVRIEGNEQLDAVSGHTTVCVVYSQPTGIAAAPVVASKAGNVYDLQGRRVSHAAAGLYIVNGRKVLVK